MVNVEKDVNALKTSHVDFLSTAIHTCCNADFGPVIVRFASYAFHKGKLLDAYKSSRVISLPKKPDITAMI